MTKQEAHALLNAVQAGFSASEATITEALMATGDLSKTTRIQPIAFDVPPMQPVASFLNRSGRVMRGAGEVVA